MPRGHTSRPRAVLIFRRANFCYGRVMITPHLRALAAARPTATALLMALCPVTTVAFSGPLSAQGLFSQSVVQAEILPGWRAPDGTRMAALHLRMDAGWHTYWRIPGDAGIAPRFDWSQSQNIASIEPIWPRPTVFRQNGLQSYGYQDELILPLRITPVNPDRPMAILGELEIGVCRDTCVPADLQVRGALRGDGDQDRRITAALGRGAESASGTGLSRATCRLEPQSRGADLTLRATVPQMGRNEELIMELPGSGYWVSNSRTWREGGDLVAQARVRDPNRGAVGINRAQVTFTILTQDRMITAQGCVGG